MGGKRRKEAGKVPEDPYRRINAFLAAAITLFFLLHGILGSLLLLFPGFPHEWAVLVWIGAVLVGLHVILSIITTQRMLTDTRRPPSPRKKRHQALKWVTGVVLLICVILHLTLFQGQGSPASLLKDHLVALILMVMLAASLGVHICTGVKSLTRDLELSKDLRLPLRLAIILISAALGTALLFAAFC